MKTKYTVITGASSGIGRAVTLKFSERNKNLILIARRKNLLEDLKSEILKKNFFFKRKPVKMGIKFNLETNGKPTSKSKKMKSLFMGV